MRKIFQFIGFIVVLGFVLVLILSGVGAISLFGKSKERISKNAILVLDLDGIILDGKKFLENLNEYSERSEIKGILIRVNSPGGVVGPSQEIYAELKRVRDELKKPVVVACNGLAASGAYYASVAANKIVVNPGTLMGSIGVIMEFVNLEGLYSWAKVNRYVLKTGKYKDTGADYRAMTDDERRLMQSVIDEVWGQFKKAVAEGRNLSPEFVNQYADGRIFSGETAVKLGFADQIGTFKDALKVIGQLTGLGDAPEIFEVPKKYNNFFEFLMDDSLSESSKISHAFKTELNKLELLGRPLFLMPGSWIL